MNHKDRSGRTTNKSGSARCTTETRQPEGKATNVCEFGDIGREGETGRFALCVEGSFPAELADKVGSGLGGGDESEDVKAGPRTAEERLLISVRSIRP
jgi:hypothetical protein